jgi:hypothetical protein
MQRKNNFKIITRGVTRLVFLVGNYAIKIPKPVIWNHFLRGLIANMEERLIWMIVNIPETAITHTKDYLCPVVWASWGGWILIMKRTEPVDPQSWEPIKELEVVCRDHKPDNYGMLDGRLVMIDYAADNYKN